MLRIFNCFYLANNVSTFVLLYLISFYFCSALLIKLLYTFCFVTITHNYLVIFCFTANRNFCGLIKAAFQAVTSAFPHTKIRSVTICHTNCGYRWRKSLAVKLSCFEEKSEVEIFPLLRFRFEMLLIAEKRCLDELGFEKFSVFLYAGRKRFNCNLGQRKPLFLSFKTFGSFAVNFNYLVTQCLYAYKTKLLVWKGVFKQSAT